MPNTAPTAPKVFKFLDPVQVHSQGKSAKVQKQIRSHVTTQQHRSRRYQDHYLKEEKRKASSKPERNQDPEDDVEEVLPIVSPSADLSSPLTAAFSGGSLAFQLYILHDPANNVGKILNDLGLDAMTVVVRLHPSLFLTSTSNQLKPQSFTEKLLPSSPSPNSRMGTPILYNHKTRNRIQIPHARNFPRSSSAGFLHAALPFSTHRESETANFPDHH